MALDTVVSASTLAYTTVARVAAVMQVPQPSPVGDEGETSLTDWQDAILAAQDEVDSLTGHAWRERKITLEYPRVEDNTPDRYGFIKVHLRHRAIRTLSNADGDLLDIRTGSTWTDYITTTTEGIGGSYWVEPDHGVLHVRRRLLPLHTGGIRVTYRYGETSVPVAIKQATSLLAAAQLATGDTVMVAGQGQGLDRVRLESKAEQWERKAHRLLGPFTEVH